MKNMNGDKFLWFLRRNSVRIDLLNPNDDDKNNRFYLEFKKNVGGEALASRVFYFINTLSFRIFSR